MADTAAPAEHTIRAPKARSLAPSVFRPGTSRLRLKTLVRLRWVAVAGQATAVLVVNYGLGFPVAIGPCLAIIALSVWLNIFLRLRYRANLRLRNRYGALMLAYDIVQLAGLLYLTGGLENPFSFLFMVPATISASTLKISHTLALGALTLVCISVLVWFHQPLPWRPDAPLDLPLFYVFGVWVALVSGLAFMAAYAWRIAQESRRMAAALSAVEEVFAQTRELSALDGLAAAAAHELGTPLATIALVSRELSRAIKGKGPYADDIELLESQTARCRDILSRLTAYARTDAVILDQVPLRVLLEEVVEPHRSTATEIRIDTGRGDDANHPPVVLRTPAVLHALGNLVENAVSFAATSVDLVSHWDDRQLTIMIRDDGPGFAPAIIDNLGEPYVTSRGTAPPLVDGGDDDGTNTIREGMGLGFFIAKTLLERSGGWLTLGNANAPDHGAIVTVHWPRGAIEPEAKS